MTHGIITHHSQLVALLILDEKVRRGGVGGGQDSSELSLLCVRSLPRSNLSTAIAGSHNEYITNLFHKTTENLYKILKHYEGPEKLSQPDVAFIIQYLALEGRAIVRVSKEKEIERELIRLQDTQCQIYEQDYKKICIEGGPGTGKSIGAEYIANQLILQQKKVLWISFNRLFTKSIEAKFSGNGFIDVKKSTQMMLDICRSNGLQLKQNDPELINKFAESALELSLNDELVKYDAVIIDEAQDILTQGFYDGLDFLIKDGWSDGSWYVFLDSDVQQKF